jgi:uncharacterized membrane protein YqgA involved in biofilm formation
VALMPVAGYLWGSFLTHNSSIDFTTSFGFGLQKAAISAFILQFCYAIFYPKALRGDIFNGTKTPSFYCTTI